MTPWDRLVEIRAERKQLTDQIQHLLVEEEQVVRDCRVFLHEDPRIHELTPRELQIMELIRTEPGIPNKQIADQMNVAERTVKFHLSGILRKYAVSDKRQLMEIVGRKDGR